MLSALGDGSEVSNQRWRSPVPDGEHDDAGDVFGAFGIGRLGEEEERNEAELVGSSRGRGRGGGHVYGERRSRVCSAGVRERARGGDELEGE